MYTLKNIQQWVQDLANKGEAEAIIRRKDYGLPEVVLYPPMPPVKPPRNVIEENSKLSEHVELITKAMKERPETFEIEDIESTYFIQYFVKDSLTGLEFDIGYGKTSANFNSNQKWIRGNDVTILGSAVRSLAADKICLEQQEEIRSIVSLYKESV